MLLNERNLLIHCEVNVEQITIEGEKSVQLYETTAANQETNEFKKKIQLNEMTDYSSVGVNRQLYYSIRPSNSENTLHAWMHHILTYLTNRDELAPNDVQGPPLRPNIGCDGSCDCQSNLWVHEVSYEEHYRKLLMSRVNVGDANHVASVDEESLRREASLVMESTNQHTNIQEQPVQSSGVEESITLMNVDTVSSASSESDDWDFVIYGSDLESEDDSEDLSYRMEESDSTSDDEYTSDDFDYDEDNNVGENIASVRSDNDNDDDDEEICNYVYGLHYPYTTSYQLQTDNIAVSHKCRQLETEENIVSEECDYSCRKSEE